MLTGEFGVAMDEKGRLLIPAKLRSQIAGNILWATKGPDDNLWLYTPEEWEVFSGKVMSNMSPFSEEDRETYRHIIAPSQELEIDKIGRILIPPSLKVHAELKKEAVVLGVIKFIEIWDAEIYASHKLESKERGVFRENQKKLKERIFF
ncbi:MAG: division/cell wall cluster transcriptional repressor MraZ [Spirochaetales bacterium]|jgi:MraZ protein|nr:division/cell wall cluster transcriptional repressor MraZ [Spirochaetales bacterium]